MERNIVVVGAGVSGLTSALLLSRNPQYKITVVAKHMPGDFDVDYCSPWAGANYMPVSAPGSEAAEWDRRTWGPLQELASKHPEAGVHFQTCNVLNRKKDKGSATAQAFSHLTSPEPWFKDLVPDFRVLPPSSLPPTIDSATSFTSVCINPSLYLPYLVSRLLSLGVTFHRATLDHIASATTFATKPTPHPSSSPVIINCTGLSSASLPGVQDPLLTPARGQTVLVRNAPSSPSNTMYCVSGTDAADPTESCYLMMRPGGGGTILGGCYQLGNWDGRPDKGLTRRIMERAVGVCPGLVVGGEGEGKGKGNGVEGLDVVREGVGLRPVREGGVRLEVEEVGVKVRGRGREEEVTVVHNYGHGGYGYQSSYGCAERVVELVDGVFAEREKEKETRVVVKGKL